jgi:predicted enzyme related to lactoylglutathione lyase
MKINLIVIRTNRPKELSDFYEQIGMKFEYHQHGKGTWHYSTEIGETVFEIYPLMKNQENSDNSLRLGFTIENLDEIIENLKKRNVEIVREPKESEWGYFAIIKDLDGRKIELKKKPAVKTKG